tara:strand:- start:97368 stop:97478 length:111 start_codon:yes stop_codon:yes gene_type:complete
VAIYRRNDKVMAALAEKHGVEIVVIPESGNPALVTS